MEFRHYINEHTPTEELKTTITDLRSTMIETGLTYGLNDDRTIELSQKLDQYITEIQKRNGNSLM
ncbi:MULTISPECIES: aspartyl-phosphate phosphatase Spo0E family protein [Pontibacillus]|uniref:Aspartyl-phosphate phosphatase Spo0E family protein n=1 Tax=Pontibacillus chungwhensis TaxID=265426 RepID=A0ABY8UXH4_9BACI|nr:MULTISPECIES: aspartyl-phosphate phosphatase Spo0E family protein [Pontibacillus]MCD5324238.1 aspartyl-phosphate phosphatase Spo0E family protein [Pontibacillus sp. HN14]WIF97707.1 aspartyl-phosphate phosphatase Spo0E family protein [Pontibacillus chungwhensis]